MKRGRPATGRKTLTQEEIERLRRIHHVKPENVGAQHIGSKPGRKQSKPLPKWVEEWFRQFA